MNTLGTHLASLNLNREDDGSYWITVSGASEDFYEIFNKEGQAFGKPIDFLNKLIVDAASNIERKTK
jgi:hypothetical protein